MAKYSLKKRACSVILAMVLAGSSTYIMPADVVQAEKGETAPKAVRSFDASYDNENAYSGNDLGCTYTKEKTTFKVWSPLATSIKLCRYEKGDGNCLIEELDMTKGDKGVWSITVNGDIVNTYYTYKVTANGQTNEAVDIYAKAAGVNGQRAMVVDLDSTDPDNWDTNYQREKTKLSDISVWEVHIRDFSIDVSSGVSAENRGKYKAFTEHTTVDGKGKVASCVDYLKELGVTHVQLMPMYDYASVDETRVTNTLGSNYNWGYDPLNYNVPEGSYSSDPYDGNVRITEMKEMIQALHDAGIKVIMDVVYNHTYDTADSNFNKIMPDYYYKLNADLTYNNNSGCGNAMRSKAAMYRKFMIDSLTYWASEYNLDGFRFDLMGIHDVTTMNQIRETLDSKFGEDTIVLYGEGWTGDGAYESDSAHKANEAQLDSGIGYFNDQIRDAIKGEHKFDKTIGLVQTNYTTGSYLEPGEKWPNNVFGGIMGSVGSTAGEWGMWRPFWSKSSDCVLAYTSAHDNLTLWDKLTAGITSDFNSTDERMIRMNKMAGATVILSRGGYFLQAGEEFARTKMGDDNSYKSSDNVNKIDWNRLNTHATIRDYYQGMLSIRQAFSGITAVTKRSGDNWNPTGNNLTWVNMDVSGVTAYTESNSVAGEWNKIAVIINNSTTDQSVTFEDADNWVIIADGNNAGIEKISESGSSTVKAAGKSVVVAVPKDTYEANIDSVRAKLEEMHNVNAAPTISIEKDSYTVNPGEEVSFKVSATDADGDTVTLSADGVPTGAKFDAATGTFTWDSVAAGTHEITIKATDGKTTSTKVITIVAESAASGIADLVAEVEAEKLVETDYTANAWTALSEALTNAKAVMAETNPSEEDCKTAETALRSAYKEIKAEKTTKEELKTYLESASALIANANEKNEKETIDDAKAVLEEAKTLANGTASAKAYKYAKENLEDSVNSLAVGDTKNGVHISTSWATPYIYIWTGTGTSAVKIAGEWPGKALTEKDSDGNYFYELPDDKEYNIIVNAGTTGGKKTNDMEAVSGNVLVEISSTSSSKEDGSDVYAATVTKKTGTITVPEITKVSLEKAIKEAKAYDETYYEAESYNALQAAIAASEEVDADKAATQVQINQAARAVRKAVVSLVQKEGVVVPDDPTETATPAPGVTEEPKTTEEPTVTQNPGSTANPASTAAPRGTATPGPIDNQQTATQEPVVATATPVVNVTNAPSETATSTPNVTATPVVTQAPSGQTPAVSDLVLSGLKVTPARCQVVNQSVKIAAEATGGIGALQYKYEIIKGDVVLQTQDFTTENTYSYIPSQAGTYQCKVTAKDDNGVVAEKTIDFVVITKKLAVKLNRKVKKMATKTLMTGTVVATGGKKAYKYKYQIINAAGKTIGKSSYTSKKVYNWKFLKAGNYKIKVFVKDATGTVVSKTIAYKNK